MQKPTALADLPIVGDFVEYERDRLAFLKQCARKYGDIVRYNDNVYIITSPTVIEQVMNRTNRDFIMPDTPVLKNLQGVSADEIIVAWRERRRGPAKGLHSNKVHAHINQIVAITEEITGRWQIGQTLSFYKEAQQILAKINLHYFFGSDGETLIRPLYNFVDVLFRLFNSPFAFPEWLPTPNLLLMRRSHAQLKNVLSRLIQQRRLSLTEKDDFLAILMQATDAQGELFSNKVLGGMLISMLIASSYPPVVALSWIGFLLAQHPEIENRLYHEINQVLGDRPPEVGDLPKLKYAECVVKETLRLYPPIWQIVREVVHDCDLNGIACKKGQNLLLCSYVIQRNPDFFPDPDQFRPERWLDEDMIKSLPKYSYFPFGGGARICLGSTLATTELVLITAMILRRFKLCLADGAKVAIKPDTLLFPDNLKIVLEKRE